MVLKFKPKLNLKIMLKGGKTIKTMKGSKNRMGLTQVKAIFLHISKQEILICYDKAIHSKKILFLAVLYVLSIGLTY